jgi:hypothetical protein
MKINSKIFREGDNSNIFDRKIISITNEIQLDSLIQQLNKSDYNYGLLKDTINFKKEFIVAYFAGSQTNGARFDNSKLNGDMLSININRISLGANCHNAKLLVTPFLLIVIEKQYLNSYKIEEKTEYIKCKEN